MILFFDFETVSDADLGQVGSWNYSRHPSTAVTCAAFLIASSLDNVAHRSRWVPGQALPVPVLRHLEGQGLVVAHNASFERAILAHCVSVANWPKVHLDRWRDTAVSARAANLPGSLEGLTEAIALPIKKDMQGSAVMVRLSTPAAWAAATPDERQRVYAYNVQDVEATHHAFWRLPAMTVDEQAAAIADAEINERGVLVDLARSAKLARLAASRKRQIEGEAFEAAGGDIPKILGPHRLKAWLVSKGIKLPKKMKVVDNVKTFVETADREALNKLLADPGLAPDVRDVLEFRVEHGKTASLAKLNKLPYLVGDDGRLRNALRFCAAHTGRWASYGVQVHNLPRNKLKTKGFDFTPFVEEAAEAGNIEVLRLLFDSPLATMSNLLRTLFVAPPGKELIGADYAAIEARGVAWLAGQQDVLDVFASGADIYVRDAAGVGSDNRQLGKTLRLGLGYGMGALKFLGTAAKDGVVLKPKDAARMVKTWRENNEHIVDFWSSVQDAAHAAVNAPGTVHRVGLLAFQASSLCLSVRLPSGRIIRYWRPKLVKVTKAFEVIDDEGNIKRIEREVVELQFFAPDDETGAFVQQSTYGGKLAENFTQAVCRDLLAAATVRLRGTIYEVPLHVHDSIVAEVPAGAGDVDEFCEIMARAPAWAAGFPIKAEGYRSTRFKG